MYSYPLGGGNFSYHRLIWNRTASGYNQAFNGCYAASGEWAYTASISALVDILDCTVPCEIWFYKRGGTLKLTSDTTLTVTAIKLGDLKQ